MALAWIRRWCAAPLARRRRGPRPALLGPPPVRPLLEELEGRALPSVSLSISNPLPFPEGDFGNSNMVFVVNRTGDLNVPVQAQFHTVDGTAHAGVDYVATSGTIALAANQTSTALSVPVIGNTIFQSNRAFTVALTDLLPGVTFAAAQSFGVGTRPFAVAVADVNGDGKPDLAVANYTSNTVSVLLNTTPTGATVASFATQATFAVGSTPVALAFADLNGDGLPDLAVANSDQTVSVLLNQTPRGAAAPLFAPQATFAVGHKASSVVVGDFNGDGKPDLAVTNFNDSDVSVLLNQTLTGAAAPSFAPQVTFTTGTSPSAVTVADLNGDGRPDLAVANSGSNSVSVLLNTTLPGTAVPTFTTQATFAAGAGAFAIAAGDLNGDGRPDLVTANPGDGTVSVLLNQTPLGTTGAAFAPQATFSAGPAPFAVALADVNGDGRPDVVTADYAGGAATVLVNLTAPGATAASFAAGQTFGAGSNPRGLAVADFNGDGQLDLAVTNSGTTTSPLSTISVLLSAAVPISAPADLAPRQAFAAGGTPFAVAIGDVNGDGKPDLAVANFGDGTVSVLLNTTPPGASAASFATQVTFAVGGAPAAVAFADLNGDGEPDLVVANYGDGTVSVLLNQTAPGATAPSFGAQATFAVGNGPIAVAVGDVNGDGRPDLAVANNSDGTISVLINQTAPGAPTASFFPQTTFAAGTAPGSVALADVNGDGKPDLAVANYADGTVSVLVNTTTPGAAAASFAPQATFAVGGRPTSVAVGDVNGDGKPDLAVANYFDGTVSVLLNQTPPGSTTPSFGPQATFAAGAGARAVTLADLNGDGRPDLVVANYLGAMATVLLNTTTPGAAPSFAPPVAFAAGGGPFALAVGDLNGDGKPDVAVADRKDGTVSVLIDLTGAPYFASPLFQPQQTFATATKPFAVAVGDVNGDGKPDLAVVDNSTGTVSVLLNTTPPGATAASFAPAATFAVGSGPSAVAFGNVNGDDKPDLAVTNYASGTVSVLLNTTPTGATVASFAPQAAFVTGAGPSAVAFADVNGDNRPDLAVTNETDGTVSVLLNTTPTGATAAAFATQATFAVGTMPSSLVATDLNGDNLPDLAVTNESDGTVSVLLNTTPTGATAASFAPQATFAVGGSPESIAFGNINGDGKPDLAVANYNDGTVSVLLNTMATGATTASFAPQATFAAGGGPLSAKFVALADVNGDNLPDLITANRNDGTVSVLLNTTAAGATTASFAPQAIFAVGGGPVFVAAADFNADTRTDLAVANSGDGTVSVLLGVGPTIGTTQAIGTIQDDDAPVGLTAVSGTTPQTAGAGSAFATNLAVDVTNAAGHLVQGVTVTFTAPGSGPSGTFAGGATTFVGVSNASGRVTATMFTANSTLGSYTVTAVATGGTSPMATFNLTNVVFADLGVTVEDGITSVVAGSANSYTITVTNAGPATVTNVTLTATVPAALQGPTFTPAAGSYDSATGAWTGLSLAQGGSVTMTLSGTVDPAATGTLTVSVTVATTGNTVDPNLADNTFSDTDTITPSPPPNPVFVNAAWAGLPPGTNPPGTGPGVIIGVNAFATLQAGIDAVSPGGTVNVAAGTYTGGVFLNKRVIVLGSGAGTVIHGPGSGVGLTITGVGVEVHDLTVSGFAVGLTDSDTAYLELHDVRLSGNDWGGFITRVTVVLFTGGSGSDTFYVVPGHLDREGDPPLDYTGVTYLTVDGEGGSNRLIVQLIDSASPATVWVSPFAISRDNPPFLLFYVATGGTFGGGVDVLLNSASDLAIIQGQQAGAPTAVFGFAGDDVFFVAVTPASAYANLTLDGGDGFDTVILFVTPGGVVGAPQLLADGTLEEDVTFTGGATSTLHLEFIEQLVTGVLGTG